MTKVGYALFDTAIGPCGIAWGERGVVGVQLPEHTAARTRARVLARFGDAGEAEPPPAVRRAIDGIVGLLRGEASDLSGVALDMEGVPAFHRRVYEVARAIAPGATASYGELAARLGSPGSARAVGQALGRNPFAVMVPCHRVLAAGAKPGGFSAPGGVTTKMRMLALEAGPPAGSRDQGATLFDGGGALGFDPAAAVAHVRASDPALARLVDAVGPFRLRIDEAPSVFVALAQAIVYQQLTAKAASTIFGRVRALFPSDEGPTPDGLATISDGELRSAGLSRAKLAALRDLARRTSGGELPTLDDVRRMDDEAIVERLTSVRGIGRWTVQMLLIFRLGRPDVLPVDDYGIRKGFALALRKRDLPDRDALEKRGARWRPYRTVASWYLWRALELPKRA